MGGLRKLLVPPELVGGSLIDFLQFIKFFCVCLCVLCVGGVPPIARYLVPLQLLYLAINVGSGGMRSLLSHFFVLFSEIFGTLLQCTAKQI